MQDLKINSETKINPLGKERFYQGLSGVNKALLLIHGFTGHPAMMEFLGKEINKQTGMAVYIPRLPGHGTNSEDFQQSTARDWLRKTYDSYLNLASDYDQVHVAGLSMGGVLAILTAARFDLKKLILIAPALYTTHKIMPLTHILRLFMQTIDRDEENDENNFASQAEKEIYANYYRQHYIAQAAELHKIILLSRKKLSKITASTLLLISKEDDQVPFSKIQNLDQKIKSRTRKIIFETSPHAINDGPDKERCAREIITFLLHNEG